MDAIMERPALLTIQRTETVYRFRLDLPGSPTGQEHTTELTTEMNERLRRGLQTVAQHMHTLAATDGKQAKRSMASDSLASLGRFLFDSLLPAPMQEALRRLDAPLLLQTNTPEIPWELLCDSRAAL